MRTTGQGHVRIIAGTLRGSKLPVVVRDGLRPTPDRTRETLFNWLAMKLAGRRVLDVFAGSGALGFEAASRGAAEVVLLEYDASAAANLRACQERLQVTGIRIVQTDALAWLSANAGEKFEGVFLDPPYASDFWARLWPLLLPLLTDGAWVYVETANGAECNLPPGLQPEKSGKTRHSKYLLAQWHKPVNG